MKPPVIILGFVYVTGLSGQSHMNWQNYCFDHPKAAFCPNRDFAAPRSKPAPPVAPPPAVVTSRSTRTVTANPTMTTLPAGAPAPTVPVSDINFQFADGAGDVLAGFHVKRLATSPLTRSLIVALEARRGLLEADIQRILDQISDVTEAGISVKDNRLVAAVSGPVVDSFLYATAPKVVLVSREMGLIGHSDAVEEAAQRLTTNLPLTGSTQMAGEWQAGCDFWVIGSPELWGAEAVNTGLRRFSATVWINDRLTVDMNFEFNEEALRKWQAMLGTVVPVGNTIHWRASVDAEELRQRLDAIAASPLGQDLAALVEAAHYLPVRAAAAPHPTKPVIYGLDGGPRTLGQDPR
jgi:hypothetical protein